MELLERLTQTWGVSGRESRVRELIIKEIGDFADELQIDTLGNLIALKKGNGQGKRIMLAAHMDEIGMQITKIENDGRIKVRNIGWIWTAALYNDKVIFQNGIVGVVGCDNPIEEIKNDSSKLYIDIGCSSKEDVEKYVKVGDYCGFSGPFHQLQNGRLCAKSFDNRAGCWLLIQALKQNDGKKENDIYYVFSVQEEIGCRGARTVAQAITVDIGISVDVSPDHLYPNDSDGSNIVGAGIGVKLGDPSAVSDEQLVELLLKCCQDHDIKYQRDVMSRGGTDSSSINLAGCGVRVIGISVIDRYAHSQSSVISWDDLQEGVRLIDKFISLHFDF